MYDFLDKIGLKTALEQIKAKFPSSLPANGGNADYAANADKLDGLHAEGFIKANGSYAYDCNTLYDTGLYLCNGLATNTPNNLIYGTLFVMPYRKPYGNGGPDYCAQIFIPNGDADDPSLWYRTSFENTWNEWKRSCDGGNADTVDGLHANDFYTSGNKPYMVGSAPLKAGSVTVESAHGFTPSAVFWWIISEGRVLHSAHSFDNTSFRLSSSPTSDVVVNFIIFR